MSVQNSGNIDTRPFILESGPAAYRKDAETLLQDGGRGSDLLSRTLMAKIAVGGKVVPYTDETATNGTAIPFGVFDPEGVFGDIPQQDIIDGDVLDIPILLFGAAFDKDKLVIENAKTLDTIIAVGTINARTVEDELRRNALIAVDTISASTTQ